jgi:hypothetical protein
VPTPFTPGTLYDALGSFGGGVNQGDSPLDLPPQTMADNLNVTVRGKFATHRPAYQRRTVAYSSPLVQATVEQGYFQGACDYLSDAGVSSLIAYISSQLFQFTIVGNVITCVQIPITDNPDIPIQPQAWLWQAEYFVIITDGLNPTLIFDGNAGTATQSDYGQPTVVATTTDASSGAFTIPPIGSAVTTGSGSGNTVVFTSVTNLDVGDIVTFLGSGTYQVLSISGLDVGLLNLTSAPLGGYLANGYDVSWLKAGGGTQLPPGRMGTYGMGRIWMTLVDGKQFVAGDLVGGASGTAANDYRDAIINITENLFIVGGGNFTIPSSGSTIQAMRFVSILDQSLGQGPLQVFTQDTVFSCNAPVDRLTWQTLTNPILTESLIGSGATGQNSTQLANGDAIFRSPDGAGSLILARQDFDVWGNVPISFEVSLALAGDDPGLLSWASAVNFDNRYVLTYGPVQDKQGVYFKGFVALNFDPLSSIRGKAPSVWDGAWSGLNTLQLVRPKVNNVIRCFAFVLNLTGGNRAIQLWEILTSNVSINDNDGTKDIPITWQFDSGSMRFGIDKRDHQYMYLSNGEIWVNGIQPGATVIFQVQYKADLYPCWTDWFSWSVCAGNDASDSQPGFQPRMGLGEPSPIPYDASTNRPMRNFYTLQTRNIIQGHCVFIGAFYSAEKQPQPKFAPMITAPICQTT